MSNGTQAVHRKTLSVISGKPYPSGRVAELCTRMHDAAFSQAGAENGVPRV